MELPEDDTAADSAYERMGRVWLGLGNLGAPCWFTGMELGGDDVPTWPDTGAMQFKGAPVRSYASRCVNSMASPTGTGREGVGAIIGRKRPKRLRQVSARPRTRLCAIR